MITLRLILYCMLFVIVNAKWMESVDFIHHNYTALENTLKTFSLLKHPQVRTKMYSIGNSVEKRRLLVLEISAAQQKRGVPNVKLIGGVFGNQPIGTEVLLHFIDYLITSYGKDNKVTYLLNTVRLHILPNMNPDGSVANSRGNWYGVPLHNVFPDLYRENTLPKQPESEAIINWMNNTSFILSATLNRGLLVIYPYSTMQNFRTYKQPSLTPDNDVFMYLAKVYFSNHPTMMKSNGTHCNNRISRITDDIVNGAQFVQQDGTMQDYNYFKHGTMELDVRISCDNHLSQDAWEENKQALVEYSLKANQGVYGVVKDASTTKPVEAAFKIIGRDIEFHTNKHGEFWKILLNGSYEIEVTAKGYHKKNEKFEISTSDSFPKLEHLEIFLSNSSVSTTTNIPKVDETKKADYESSTQLQKREPVVSSLVSRGAIRSCLCYLLLLSFLVFLDLNKP